MTRKNSFVFYHDWAELLKKLPTDEIGNITLALIEYSESGTVPELSPIADIVFTAFKQAIDKDIEKWEATCQKNAENGRKGGRPQKPKKTNGFFENPKEPKKADNEYEYEYDIDIENEINTPPTPSKEAGEDFDEFWKAYPKKVAKAQAQKAWSKLKPDKALLTVIIEALKRQKQSAQWLRDNGQYIPYPATWLNGRRWEDDLKQSSQMSPKYEDFDPNDPYKAWRENSEQLQLSKKYDDFDPADPYRDWK